MALSLDSSRNRTCVSKVKRRITSGKSSLLWSWNMRRGSCSSCERLKSGGEPGIWHFNCLEVHPSIFHRISKVNYDISWYFHWHESQDYKLSLRPNHLGCGYDLLYSLCWMLKIRFNRKELLRNNKTSLNECMIWLLTSYFYFSRSLNYHLWRRFVSRNLYFLWLV